MLIARFITFVINSESKTIKYIIILFISKLFKNMYSYFKMFDMDFFSYFYEYKNPSHIISFAAYQF